MKNFPKIIQYKWIKSLFLLSASIVMSGCVSQNVGLTSSSANALEPAQTFNAANYEIENSSKVFSSPVLDQTFKNGDQVTITVNGFEEFSGVYTVDRSGDIFLGHIGKIKVTGLTIPELQSNLYQEYSSCCLVKPNVSITREGQAFGKIVVDGAVNNAGVFEIDEVINLSHAVALGGGVNDVANTELVMLSRIIDGKRKVSQVNLNEIRLAGAADPLIYPNDVIFVQDSQGRLLYQDFVKTLPLISAVLLATTRP